MTKKYMDFAPVRKTTAGAGPTVKKQAVRPQTKVITTAPKVRVSRATAQKVAPKVAAPTVTVSRTTVSHATVSRTAVPKAVVSQTGGMPMRKSTVRLGEIEDLNPKFVKTDVPKRPLGDGTEAKKAKSGATEAKAKKIGGRLRRRGMKAEAKVAKAEVGQTNTARMIKTAYAVPRTPFINQDKVAKRPLSKNVYQKQIDALDQATKQLETKSEEKILTIVSKPEKDSKVGVVIAIVLTIILGAVAGTVAFLLLPK